MLSSPLPFVWFILFYFYFPTISCTGPAILTKTNTRRKEKKRKKKVSISLWFRFPLLISMPPYIHFTPMVALLGICFYLLYIILPPFHPLDHELFPVVARFLFWVCFSL